MITVDSLAAQRPCGVLQLPVAGGASGLVDVTVFRRHEGVVAFQVSTELLDGIHEAKGRRSISMTPGSISALATVGSRATLLGMWPRSVQHDGNNAHLPALAVDHLRLVCDDGSQDFLLFARVLASQPGERVGDDVAVMQVGHRGIAAHIQP